MVPVVSQLMSKYNKDTISELEPIIHDWRVHRRPFPTRYQMQVSTLFQNVCRDRWDAHFSRIKTEWTHTVNVKDSVILAWIDYLLWPKQVLVRGKYMYCLAQPEYHSLAYTLFLFKVQFPRVVTTLQLRDIGLCPYRQYQSGLAVEDTWLPTNLCGLTQLRLYKATHQASVHLRSLLATHGPMSYEEVKPILYSKMWSLANTRVTQDEQDARERALFCAYWLHFSRATVKYDGLPDGLGVLIDDDTINTESTEVPVW